MSENTVNDASLEDESTELDLVQLDGLVVLKIIKHCQEMLPDLVTGQLLGLDISKTVEVTNCFPFPAKVPEENEEDIEAEAQGKILFAFPLSLLLYKNLTSSL
jgi:translation initiation factor 3 subunit H